MVAKPKLSSAQVRFMNEHAPAFFAWLAATGQGIGIKIQPWQKRIVEALIRKDFLTPDGNVTDAGHEAWKKATDKAVAVAKRNGATIHPRVAEIKGKIKGQKASLIIIDEA